MLGGVMGFHYGVNERPSMELLMRGEQNEIAQAKLPFNQLEWSSPSRLAFECGTKKLSIEQGTENFEATTIPISIENLDLLACVLETSTQKSVRPVTFSIRPLGGD
jgi:hypothetical protein